MTKILFLCHGNICRSPMAEFVMKYLAAQAGCSGDYQIDSAAVSTEEIGNLSRCTGGLYCFFEIKTE